MSSEPNLQNPRPYAEVLDNMMNAIMHAQRTYAHLERLDMQRASRMENENDQN